jgi:hypothetical protein
MKYSKSEIDFLKLNYSRYGSEFCSKHLNRDMMSIRKKANRLGLYISRETKSKIQKENSLAKKHFSITDAKLDLESILKCKNKFVAYMLGLLWADGYVNIAGYNNTIKLEVAFDDSVEFLKIFEKTGNWNFSNRERLDRKKQGLIHINNKKLATHLYNNGYIPKNKNLSLAENIIPNNFKSYWLLGIIDGDGCWYPPQKQFSITGYFGQSWKPIEDILSRLNIKCSIKNRQYHKNKFSVLRVCGRKNLVKLGNYVYNDKDFPSLSRKRRKYLNSIATS